jgi:oxygen-independent coproporphyrinogen-3 oxidase
MRTSLPLFAIENELRHAEQQGLIERQPQRIAPTRQGQRFLNRLLETFIAERD